MKQANTPRIWGYARVSTNEQVLSPEAQAEDIQRCAERISADTHGEIMPCVKESESGAKIAWRDRPKLRELLDRIQHGDHLIIWKLDRAERSPFEVPMFLKYLADHGITLHVIEGLGGMPLDMDSAAGRAMAAIFGIASDMLIENLRNGTRRTLQYLKSQGLPYNQPGYGQRAERLPPKPGDKKIKHRHVWDEEECSHIREMVYRHEIKGESLPKIGADFHARKLKTARGRLWVKDYRCRQIRGRRLRLTRLYEVYHWYCKLREEGKLPPELIIAVPPEQ